MRYVQASLLALAIAAPALPVAAGPAFKGTIHRSPKRVVTLTVTAEPRSAVTIGGSYRGHTPLTLKISPGPHTVILESPDGQREVRNINPEPGADLSVHHSFTPSESGGTGAAEATGDKTPYLEALGHQNLGVLDVSSSVPGRVFIDDNDTLRSTPVTDLEATAGSHRIKVVFVTGGEKELDVNVQAGKRAKVTVAP